MSRVVLRFETLVLKEEGERSTIHFNVEDDAAIARCRAVIEEREDGAIDVGSIEGYGGAIDPAAFREVVERVYWEQVKMIGRLAAVVPVTSCIVALREKEVAIEGGRVASGW
ncbi:MAG: hypothetical protein ACLQVI_06390 [Polyangiaceae bacterium]|jgi:hypothetical protein